MPRISVITAFLNEEGNLPLFRQRLLEVLDMLGLSWEVLLIDDHSDDDSPRIAREWVGADPRVRYVRMSRTFGSHAAYSAGIERSKGDGVILLAADLQDPPEVIPQLLAEWQKGAHVVWASRAERKGESWMTTALASCYYKLIRKLALPNMPAKGADFLLADRKVIDAYKSIPEKNTSFLGMLVWMGFRQTTIDYVKQARHSGKSKWNLSKKVKLLIDTVVSFSYGPIRLISGAGVMVSFLGMLYAGVVIVRALFGNLPEGWSSLMVVMLILGGFQLLMLGVLGEYLWRAFDEARGRPRYLVEEELVAGDEASKQAA